MLHLIVQAGNLTCNKSCTGTLTGLEQIINSVTYSCATVHEFRMVPY